jgi:hypothetical protein
MQYAVTPVLDAINEVTIRLLGTEVMPNVH